MSKTKSTKYKTVTWPTSTYFTFKDLLKINSNFNKEITLRVRLSDAIESGKVVEIGSIPGGLRRPPKVYTMVPVTQIALDKAEADGISVLGEARKLINVINVTQPVTNFSSPKSVSA